MNFVFAFGSLLLFLSQETKAEEVKDQLPVVMQPWNKGFPDQLSTAVMPELPPMPEIPQQVQNHGWHGGYGGYRPYKPLPEPRPRPEKCRDRETDDFCQAVVHEQLCERRRFHKKCAKTCGACKAEEACVDSGIICSLAQYQPGFYCSLPWFVRGCKKTCGKCRTTMATTTAPAATTRETTSPTEFECVDTSWNCQYAKPFRCNLFWFRSGCKKSCGICQPATEALTTVEKTTTTQEATTTTQEATTTSTTVPATTTTTAAPKTTTSNDICKDKRDDCNTFLDWYCDIPVIADECQRFCGRCSQGTAKPTTTVQPTEFEMTSSQTSFESTVVPTEAPDTTQAETSTTAETATKVNTEETTESEMTPEPEPVTGEEQLCVDLDEKNCSTWVSLGLCYNPQYQDQMEMLCPLSCQICQP